ncbi:MAG: peptidoglycan DD-metalloendopeptidase family protein [Candidatus Obscuribacter sp.]|nr:peptidoglycan DD-metalloendopeptidase family protein [Candidatus Obscuribacter sp.]MDQ5965607.1 Peptidoglycan DD-metalloendopeptidase family protein [Cyanobacteriota bacterium erpe_2018_sw_39hr_WHONDRS-SW48-000098_B_bin.30]MBK9206187.1 peptidoglycan DD-metalloendopeptidase family protein [Candidatus Obscuribacter sp.]MBK9618096.1 peptidoglycan DD-metalloendopeptidase family protein [Candidatus Obscuribacter sp.]MBK9770328.1 peptidoglycan DD-metalloendopeptidase family protein [Candidatus Obs
MPKTSRLKANLPALVLSSLLALSVTQTNAREVGHGLAQSSQAALAETQSNGSEAKKRLLQQERQKLEKEKRAYHEKAQQLRKVERKAVQKLYVIQKQLNETTGQLSHTKNAVAVTEKKVVETEKKLNSVRSTEGNLTSCASRRLKEIYQGERLSFVEMLFQVDNLQTLLDRLYYQERVAEQDQKLIKELRARGMQLSQNKNALDQKKNALGEMVSQIAQKAMAIAKEKLSQQQVAEQLRSQRAFYEQAERELANESSRLEKQIFIMENHNRKRGGPIAVGSGNMCMPLRAPVTSPFGWRKHPIFGVRKMHTGIDLAGPNRSAIHAADAGNVLYTGWYGGYGKVVIVSHGNNMATLYAHLSRVAVSVGDNVSKGDVIAYEGTTGFSTGPHLHFEVRVNGKPQNPLSYVR